MKKLFSLFILSITVLVSYAQWPYNENSSDYIKVRNRLRSDSVLIGSTTTEPQQQFHVEGNSLLNGILEVNSLTTSSGNVGLFFSNGLNENFGYRLEIEDDGTFYSNSIFNAGGRGNGDFKVSHERISFACHNASIADDASQIGAARTMFYAQENNGANGNSATTYIGAKPSTPNIIHGYQLSIGDWKPDNIGNNTGGLHIFNNTTSSISSGASQTTRIGYFRKPQGTLNNSGSGSWTLIGLDVDIADAADINYAALFNGGNVGIGTSAPTEVFHSNGGLRIDATVSNQLYVSDAQTFVGIGGATSRSFIETLNLTGKAQFSDQLSIGGINSGTYAIRVDNSWASGDILNRGGCTLGMTAGNVIYLNSNGATPLQLQKSGSTILNHSFSTNYDVDYNAPDATVGNTTKAVNLGFVTTYWDGVASVDNTSTQINIKATDTSGNGEVEIQPVGVDGIKVDNSSTAGETRFMLYDVDNGTYERVTVGTADSGGAGFKVLRIPN